MIYNPTGSADLTIVIGICGMPIVESEPGASIRSDLQGAPAVNDRAYALAISLSIGIPSIITLRSCEKKCMEPLPKFYTVNTLFSELYYNKVFGCSPKKF